MNMKMDGTFVGSVVLSGLSIVFIALLLLIFFVWLMDKVFSLINNAKKDNAPEDKEDKKPLPRVSAPPAVSASSETDGISDEVVAVISAAVAAMSAESGTAFKIKSIKRSGSSRRGAWGNASAAESTRSFNTF